MPHDLELRPVLSQRQVLAQQQVQALQLLQMNTLELQARIQQELLEKALQVADSRRAVVIMVVLLNN